VGCRSLAGANDPARWEALAFDDARRWQALRRSPAAAWIGLALPRFLARAPYGAKTTAIEAFAFEEIEGRPAPDALCWASSAFLCALALARGDEADDADEIDDLPFFSFRSEGDVEMYPSAEVFWGERAADAALSRGLVPLLSARDRNNLRLVRLQSIADPPHALGGGAASGDDDNDDDQ
jgi:predicted component of type VI protein secretion system